MYKSVNDFLPNKSEFFHVAIIPDGARRWANKNHVNYDFSYNYSMQHLTDVCKLLFDRNVDIITIFLSSVYNFKRPAIEIESFCKAESNFISEQIPLLASDYDAMVKVVGNTSELPEYMQEAIKKNEPLVTSGKKIINLCVNYSSLVEISEAALCDEKTAFVNNLSIPFPVNIVVRSGNANVMSDFLLPQCASARLYFLEELFNDISVDVFDNILSDYRNLELKYGE